MRQPHYVNLDQAREILAQIGVELTPRQMKRATDKDAAGRRKLPFFIDPVEHKLKIEKETLLNVYQRIQNEAEKNCRTTPDALRDKP